MTHPKERGGPASKRESQTANRKPQVGCPQPWLIRGSAGGVRVDLTQQDGHAAELDVAGFVRVPPAVAVRSVQRPVGAGRLVPALRDVAMGPLTGPVPRWPGLAEGDAPSPYVLLDPQLVPKLSRRLRFAIALDTGVRRRRARRPMRPWVCRTLCENLQQSRGNCRYRHSTLVLGLTGWENSVSGQAP